MYIAHTSTLLFKDKRFRSQVPTGASTLASNSDQFRSSWRTKPCHTPRMRTGLSLQRKGPGRGTLSPPDVHPQTFALIKADIDSCCLFVPCNRLFHNLYVQTAGQNDIIGIRRDFRCKRASKRNSAQGRICHLIPNPKELVLENEGIVKRR